MIYSVEFGTEESKVHFDVSGKLMAVELLHLKDTPAIDVACKDRLIATEYDGSSISFSEGREFFCETSIRNGATRSKRCVLEIWIGKMMAKNRGRSTEWLKTEVLKKVDGPVP